MINAANCKNKSKLFLLCFLTFFVFFSEIMPVNAAFLGFETVKYGTDNDDNDCNFASETSNAVGFKWWEPPLTTVIDACVAVGNSTYDRVKGGVGKFMMVGFGLWLAIFLLKVVSSLQESDPMENLTKIGGMMLKTGIAYAFLMNRDEFFDLISIITGTAAAYVGVEGSSTSGGLSGIVAPLKGMAEEIHGAVSKFGGKGSFVMCFSEIHEFQLFGDPIFSITDPGIYVSGCLMWIGSLILKAFFPFLLFDALLRIGITAALCPLFIAAWPFPSTSPFAKKGFDAVLNVAFTFMFLKIGLDLGLLMLEKAAGVDVGQGGTDDMTRISCMYRLGTLGEGAHKCETSEDGASIFTRIFVFVAAMFYTIQMMQKTGEYANFYAGTSFTADTSYKVAKNMTAMLNKGLGYASKGAGVAAVALAKGGIVAANEQEKSGGGSKLPTGQTQSGAGAGSGGDGPQTNNSRNSSGNAKPGAPKGNHRLFKRKTSADYEKKMNDALARGDEKGANKALEKGVKAEKKEFDKRKANGTMTSADYKKEMNQALARGDEKGAMAALDKGIAAEKREKAGLTAGAAGSSKGSGGLFKRKTSADHEKNLDKALARGDEKGANKALEKGIKAEEREFAQRKANGTMTSADYKKEMNQALARGDEKGAMEALDKGIEAEKREKAGPTAGTGADSKSGAGAGAPKPPSDKESGTAEKRTKDHVKDMLHAKIDGNSAAGADAYNKGATRVISKMDSQMGERVADYLEKGPERDSRGNEKKTKDFAWDATKALLKGDVQGAGDAMDKAVARKVGQAVSATNPFKGNSSGPAPSSDGVKHTRDHVRDAMHAAVDGDGRAAGEALGRGANRAAESVQSRVSAKVSSVKNEFTETKEALSTYKKGAPTRELTNPEKYANDRARAVADNMVASTLSGRLVDTEISIGNYEEVGRNEDMEKALAGLSRSHGEAIPVMDSDAEGSLSQGMTSKDYEKEMNSALARGDDKAANEALDKGVDAEKREFAERKANGTMTSDDYKREMNQALNRGDEKAAMEALDKGIEAEKKELATAGAEANTDEGASSASRAQDYHDTQAQEQPSEAELKQLQKTEKLEKIMDVLSRSEEDKMVAKLNDGLNEVSDLMMLNDEMDQNAKNFAGSAIGGAKEDGPKIKSSQDYERDLDQALALGDEKAANEALERGIDAERRGANNRGMQDSSARGSRNADVSPERGRTESSQNQARGGSSPKNRGSKTTSAGKRGGSGSGSN